MSPAETYRNFADLARDRVEGRDYRVAVRPIAGATVSIIAPHGGRIEQGTSQIARQVAGAEFNLYLFEGLCDRSYANLHLTSTRFDDPRVLGIIADSRSVISMHGYKDEAEMTLLGGLDVELKHALAESLERAGIAVKLAGHGFPATDPRNVCNRGKSGRGVQIELSRALRLSGRLAVAGAAIRSVLMG